MCVSFKHTHETWPSVVCSVLWIFIRTISSFSCSCSYWSADCNSHLILYGSKTLCLTVRKEYRPIVIEDKVLKKKFGARREDVTEDWRKLHIVALYDFYSSRMSFGRSDDEESERLGIWHVLGRCTWYFQGFDGQSWRKETSRQT